MLELGVVVCGLDVRALVDSGATHNFIAASMVKRAKLCTSRADEMTVVLADGSRSTIAEVVWVPVSLADGIRMVV